MRNPLFATTILFVAVAVWSGCQQGPSTDVSDTATSVPSEQTIEGEGTQLVRLTLPGMT